MSVAPKTRDDEACGTDGPNVLHAFAEDGGVVHLKGGHIDLVRVLLLLSACIAGLHECLAHEHDGDDDAHDTQWVSHGATEGRRRSVESELHERLLCSTERGCIRRGTAEYADHVRQGNARSVRKGDGHKRAEHNDAHRKHVKRQSARMKRAEEARADL